LINIEDIICGGEEISMQKNPPMAVWKLVTRPKTTGGLEVIKLRVQDDALLMRNLHKFFSNEGLPWVKLI
jgi:hypothetical protein